MFPAHGQLATTFFSDDPNAPLFLAQHQNVNCFVAYLFMFTAIARAKQEGVHEPVWCAAIPQLERILGLSPLPPSP